MSASYPFDEKFRKVVDDSDYGWSVVLQLHLYEGNDLTTKFAAAGYSLQQVTDCLKELKEKPINELVELALPEALEGSPALGALQVQASRDAFDKAKELCTGSDANERVIGVDMLMRKPGQTFESEAAEIVCNMVQNEQEAIVLEELAYALYHLSVENRSEYLHRLMDYPNTATRYALAVSLGGLNDDLALTDLITLSRDSDDETRNWATFGLHLGMDEEREDRQDVRDALCERLADSHDETRHEALVGLASYKDPRVIEPLVAALQSKSVWELSVEAAGMMADPALYEPLIALRSWWDLRPELLEEAIENCRPSHPEVSEV